MTLDTLGSSSASVCLYFVVFAQEMMWIYKLWHGSRRKQKSERYQGLTIEEINCLTQ